MYFCIYYTTHTVSSRSYSVSYINTQIVAPMFGYLTNFAMQEAYRIGFRYYNIDVSFLKLWYKFQQDRQYTHDVTLRRVQATIVELEKQ
jgi:hypothetical protein